MLLTGAFELTLNLIEESQQSLASQRMDCTGKGELHALLHEMSNALKV